MGNAFTKFDSTTLDGLGYRIPSQYQKSSAKSVDTLRKLEQLLRACVNYEPSELPTILVSLYYLGASTPVLCEAFDTLADEDALWPEENPIADSIGEGTLRDFLGLPEYKQRYFEFYRDQLTEFTDWHQILANYLPLIGTRLLAKDGAPIQLLAVAVEIDDPVLAMLSLSWASVLQCVDLDEVPADAPTIISLNKLLKEKIGSEQIVTVHAFCELILCKLPFSNCVADLVPIFAHLPPAPGTNGVFPDPETTTSLALANDYRSAPKVRAHAFAESKLFKST